MALRLDRLLDIPPAERQQRMSDAWEAAVKEIRTTRARGIEGAICVPSPRTSLYAKKNLVAVAFVMIENRTERGTLMGSVDGSARRTFNMPTAKMIIEPGSTDQFLLGAVPYSLCKWVNDRFPSAHLGHPCYEPLDGAFTDEERAEWLTLIRIADTTNRMVDRKRKGPTETSRKLLLNRNEVA